MHRVMLTERHYDLVRRYMVLNKLPSARAATEKMIEVAVDASGRARVSEMEDPPPAHTNRRDGALARSSA